MMKIMSLRGCVAAVAISLFLVAFSPLCGATSYIDGRNLMVTGRAFGDTFTPYSRLPMSYEAVSRKTVWDLGKNSSCVALRFRTDSKSISARWKVSDARRWDNMSEICSKGLDLYVLEKGEWHFCGAGRPRVKDRIASEKGVGTYECVIISGISDGVKEYLLYLPNYETIFSIEIGYDDNALMEKPAVGTPLSDPSEKPVVFYGTSITQGCSASRPGMTYPAIVGRRTGRPVVNLGFSGNGHMDKSMARLISEIDARQYVIDCLPNMSSKDLPDSARFFITCIADAHPDVPVYMVENMYKPARIVKLSMANEIDAENAYWYSLYRQLRKEGYRNLHYVKCSSAGSEYGEFTVDGTHMTDMGHSELARILMRAGVGK